MDSLVSTEWLAREHAATDIVLLDAGAHPTDPARDAAAEFAAGHIPGARFLDLASLTDAASPVPAALPTRGQVAARLAALGATPASRIVLYDDSAVKTSARAWFILRTNGCDRVAILDGGLAKWRAEGRPTASGAPQDSPTSHVSTGEPAQRGAARVRTKAEMLANLATRAEQVVDARDTGRFSGATGDAVHDLPGGHIPGARNLFFRDLFREDGTLRPADELRAAFEGAGIDLARPVVATCGSGVTASVLLFALDRLGKHDTALYDGSWSEWGADPGTPKETGEATR